MIFCTRTLCLSIVLCGLAGLAGEAALEAETSGFIPEDQLLDVGVMVLDPGIEKKSSILTGYEYINPELRRSEAAYIAIHLMRTLQRTESFGLVRMMPSNSVSADLFVTGQIRKSSGRRLDLELEVVDATGRRWFKKRYKRKANPSIYVFSVHENIEPFQEVYDQFGEDLRREQSRMTEEYLEVIQQVAELRFAAQLAPGIFGDYLSIDRRGRVALERLPARDDPMCARIRTLQTRDESFLDLLSDRYKGFYASMDRPYDEFRATRFDVETALHDSRSQAALANSRNLFAPRSESPWDRHRDARLATYHRRQVAAQAEYLDEIANAFASELDPLKLELEGEVLRFEGTIEDQYRQWQRLLEKIFETETGMSAKNRVFAMDFNTRH